MVRLANISDAEELERLNNEFNGDGETSLKNIKLSLVMNKQEVVIVDEDAGTLTGFICIQMKKSFCYDEFMPEITEVYVNEKYRRNGIAEKMIRFAEKYCSEQFPLHKFEILTGEDNSNAQAAYKKYGYSYDGELHLSRRVK